MEISSKSAVSAEEATEVAAAGMPSFASSLQQIGTERRNMHAPGVPSFGTLDESIGFCVEDGAELTINPVFNPKLSGQAVGSDPLQYRSYSKSLPSSDITTPAGVGSPTLPKEKVDQTNLVRLPTGHFENWGESTMAVYSPRTDTSDGDTDDKNQRFEQGQLDGNEPAVKAASDSSDRSKDKMGDQKTLRRLAQNREAARKSRLRKKGHQAMSIRCVSDIGKPEKMKIPSNIALRCKLP